jgi:general secretion pathway protein K
MQITKARKIGILNLQFNGCCNALVNEKGSALLITLLIITLLISITVEFIYEVYVSTSALSNWGNAQKATLIAKSGQALTTTYLKELKRLSYTSLSERVLPVKKYFDPDSLLSIKIEDENAKFNINSIIYQNGLTNSEALVTLQRLFEYLHIDSALAMAIADWIDPDSEPRLKDSEYAVKNAYLWSIDEMKLIKGVDKDIFETILPFITVFGDNTRININTAKLAVLVSLHKDMTETLAQKIIYYRENTPFEDETYIVRVSGMETIGGYLQGKIAVKSSYFRVTSTAVVNEIKRMIESVIDTSLKVHYWREV